MIIIPGYRIEFSCLYIPQGHNYFISIYWLQSTSEYVIIYCEQKLTYINVVIYLHLNVQVIQYF